MRWQEKIQEQISIKIKKITIIIDSNQKALVVFDTVKKDIAT